MSFPLLHVEVTSEQDDLDLPGPIPYAGLEHARLHVDALIEQWRGEHPDAVVQGVLEFAGCRVPISEVHGNTHVVRDVDHPDLTGFVTDQDASHAESVLRGYRHVDGAALERTDVRVFDWLDASSGEVDSIPFAFHPQPVACRDGARHFWMDTDMRVDDYGIPDMRTAQAHGDEERPLVECCPHCGHFQITRHDDFTGCSEIFYADPTPESQRWAERKLVEPRLHIGYAQHRQSPTTQHHHEKYLTDSQVMVDAEGHSQGFEPYGGLRFYGIDPAEHELQNLVAEQGLEPSPDTELHVYLSIGHADITQTGSLVVRLAVATWPSSDRQAELTILRDTSWPLLCVNVEDASLPARMAHSQHQVEPSDIVYNLVTGFYGRAGGEAPDESKEPSREHSTLALGLNVF